MALPSATCLISSMTRFVTALGTTFRTAFRKAIADAAAFHFDRNGKIGFKVMAYALCRDRLAVVADDTGLYPHISPRSGDNLCEAYRYALDECPLSAQGIETIFCRRIVERGDCLDVVQCPVNITSLIIADFFCPLTASGFACAGGRVRTCEIEVAKSVSALKSPP